ncbi:MAG: DNA polymerase [Desulfotomaculales bacterium]
MTSRRSGWTGGCGRSPNESTSGSVRDQPVRSGPGFGISQSDAKFFIDRFFAAYPTVATLVEALVEEARRTGYARTLLGRRRPLPGLAAADRRGAGADRRNAINTLIQGSAADLMKLAMLRLHKAWRWGTLWRR